MAILVVQSCLYDAIYSFKGISVLVAMSRMSKKQKAMLSLLGKLVAAVTSGPGATNAITGTADAMSDSVPFGFY